jgi:hypothetical protein
MKKPLLAAAGALALTALFAASAGADTFKGSCHVTGKAHFGTPIMGQPTDNDSYDFNSGPPDASTPDGTKCTGNLNGTQGVYDAVATVTGKGSLSCAASQGDGGSGALIFPGTHSVFLFGFAFHGAASEVFFTATYNGGSADGHASFQKYVSPSDAATKCGPMGSGLQDVGFDADFTSDQTINGYNTGPAAGGGPSSYGTGPTSANTQQQQAVQRRACAGLRGTRRTRCLRRQACLAKHGRQRTRCLAALNRRPARRRHR